MLNGFTPPYTPSGRSSLAPPPPWHYAGQVLSLAFSLDKAAAQALLPDGFGEATGMGSGHFCEWQATTDGSEMLDPVYAQYKEFFVLIETIRRDERALYCPFIYVDQDISLARGWLQGWPKKLGSVWMTRSYDLEHVAAAPIRAGTRMGASLAVKDRRLAEATIELTGGHAAPIGFLAFPTYGLVGAASLIGEPQPGEKRIVRARLSGKVMGPNYAANGRLAFHDSPRDELSMLRPRAVTGASLATIALSVEGAVSS